MAVATRVEVKNILFATDFSPNSEAAIPYVDAIAHRYDAKVFVAHVLSPAAYAFVPPEGGVAAFEAVRDAAGQQLEGFAGSPAIRSRPNQTLLVEGDVADAIRALVTDHEIDLLVLGSHGRKGLNWFVMGSIAETILKRAPCPVLIIGPRARHDLSHSSRGCRILYATDFRHESLAALSYALDLAQEHQAKLTLLTVLAGSDANSTYRATLLASTTSRLRELVPEEAELWCQPEFIVEFGSAPEIIHEQARDDCDLIILGGRTTAFPPPPGAHRFGSVTHKVITDAPCAVLSVPERTANS